MKKTCLLSIVLLFLLNCQSPSPTDTNDKESISSSQSDSGFSNADETEMMAHELQMLVANGDPDKYYHWNTKKAEKLLQQLSSATGPEAIPVWMEYCLELIHSGNSKQSIAEIENHLAQYNMPYDQLLNPQTYMLFEILALAYLRNGEEENCQNLHTPFSCIVPIQEPAYHQLPQGSEGAIELYQMLYDKMPLPKYRWLINLAYMTLGKHPQAVPEKYLITFPNWNLEQKGFPRFKEVAMNVGVAQNGLSGGVCLEDFNNDGFIDIFATSYGMEDPVKYFMNTGNGSFHEHDAGLDGIVSGLNTIHADYDNDGFIDILVLRGAWLGAAGTHPNSLLRNMGDGTFTDVTRSAGILSYHPTQTAAWADYNKDGWLDLFIGNESVTNSHPCEFYQNNGDGTFTNITGQKGLGKIEGFVKGVDWGDINNDGWPELYISMLDGQNLLFLNDQGAFTDISTTANVQEPINSFPCWFWDVNNDGFQDIFVSGYDINDLQALPHDYAVELLGGIVETEKPRLYLNNGDLTFTDVSKKYGIARTMYSMGANFGDIDSDGYLDFYVGTGAPHFSTVVPNRMFRNVDGLKFEEVTSAGGFGHIQKGHGIGFGDLDNDGDEDIYAVMGGAFDGDDFTNVLFENPNKNKNWLIVQLEGTSTNRSAIGSRIELTLNNGQKIVRWVDTGGSFGSSTLQQEIGLGEATAIDQLEIFWQNGETQVFQSVDINQKIKLIEGQEEYQIVEYKHAPFTEVAQGEHLHHH